MCDVGIEGGLLIGGGFGELGRGGRRDLLKVQRSTRRLVNEPGHARPEASVRGEGTRRVVEEELVLEGLELIEQGLDCEEIVTEAAASGEGIGLRRCRC